MMSTATRTPEKEKLQRPRFDAVMPRGKFFEVEEGYDERWSPVRRLMLTTLTRSSEDLLSSLEDGGEETGEALLDLVEKLDKFEAQLKMLAEFNESAKARLSLVLLYAADNFFSEASPEN